MPSLNISKKEMSQNKKVSVAPPLDKAAKDAEKIKKLQK